MVASSVSECVAKEHGSMLSVCPASHVAVGACFETTGTGLTVVTLKVSGSVGS